ncbi:MAG: tetratricopeptide repeat protein [bacterium]|nr:tetratricopeptide repeat protein [bacterium]
MKVAVCQMDFNPSFYAQGVDYLEGILSLEEKEIFKIEDIKDERKGLKESYIGLLNARLDLILSYCKKREITLIAFPEYSIPSDSLPLIKDYADKGITVISGSHITCKEDEGIYKSLDINPRLGRNISTIFHQGEISLIEKSSLSIWEKGKIKPGKGWRLIEDDLAFSVFLSDDFIDDYDRYVKSADFRKSRFIIILAYTPITPKFEKGLNHHISSLLKSGHTILYTNVSSAGGSRIIYRGKELSVPIYQEALIILDLDKQKVDISPFIYENTLPDFRDFKDSYEKGKDKRAIIQAWEDKIFLWWKISLSSVLGKRLEKLVHNYPTLSREDLDSLLENVSFPENILTIDEWRFIKLGEIITLLDDLKKDRRIREVVDFYKRRQQTLIKKVREVYLDSYYLKRRIAQEKVPIRLEEDWSYKDFGTLSGEVEDRLIAKPILNKEEVKNCYILTQKIRDFMERFKFRDYLFLSPSGTGKTSLLSFLSYKACEAGYQAIWISIKEKIPEVEALFKRLSIKKDYVLIFDDIDKIEGICLLLSKIKQRFPSIPIWCTAETERFDPNLLKGLNFKIENLPSFLEHEDIEMFLPYFEDEDYRRILSTYKKIPFTHLVAVYTEMKKRDKEALHRIKDLPLSVDKFYQEMYDSMDNYSKFALKLLSYLDGATEDVLKKGVEYYGGRSDVVQRLIDKQILYYDSICRISPNFQEIRILNTQDGLKIVVRKSENTSPYERERVLPDILLDLGETEGIISLAERYDELNQDQRERYVSLLKEKKDNPTILWVISNLCEKRRDLQELADYAIKRFECMEKDGSFARVLYNFGYAYSTSNNVDMAITCFEKANGFYANDPKVWYNLGLLYMKKNRLYKAKDAFSQALQMNKDDAKILYNLGVCLGRLGKPDKEIDYIKKAIDIEPKNVTFWHGLGICYKKKTNINKAIWALRKALDITKDDPTIWYTLGECFGEIGDITEEIRCFKKAITYDPTNALYWYKIGGVYGDKDLEDKEIMCYVRAVTLDPECAIAWGALGISFGKKGDLTKEERFIKKAKELQGFNPSFWYDLGVCFGKKGRHEKQKECFEKAYALGLKDVEVLYNLGDLYEKEGEFDKAILCFKKALEVDKSDKALNNLGVLYERSGRLDEAIKILEKIEEKGATIWYNLGCLYKEEHDIEHAISCFKKTTEIDEFDYKAWNNLGVLYSKLKEYDEAEKSLLKTIDINETDTYALNNLGIIYEERDELEKAAEYLKRAVELDPEDGSTWYNLGVIYEKQGRFDEAIACFNKTVEIDKEDLEAYAGLGIIYGKKGMLEEEFSYFEKAVSINPYDSDSLFNLGICYFKNRWIIKAIDCFERALKIDENDTKAWNNLGVCYIDRDNYTSAMECFSKAIVTDPDDSEIWYNLGVVNTKRNDFQKAIKCFRKVIEIDETNFKTWYNLGIIYGNTGRFDQAIECMKKSEDLDPKDKRVKQLLGTYYGIKGDKDKEIAYIKKAGLVDLETLTIHPPVFNYEKRYGHNKKVSFYKTRLVRY